MQAVPPLVILITGKGNRFVVEQGARLSRGSVKKVSLHASVAFVREM